jgi:hypothetical protein
VKRMKKKCVTVDGTRGKFEAAQPQMQEGRVLVPFRGVFEQIGATVDRGPTTQSVIEVGNAMAA